MIAPVVRNQHAARDGERVTEGGPLWPRPRLVHARPGDVVLVHHTCPHAPTRVEAADPRMMIYFRVNHTGRKKGERLCKPEALVDIWLEYEGMAAVVQREREREREGMSRL